VAPITLLSENQEVHTFANAEDAVVYIGQHQNETFTLYAPVKVYNEVKEHTVEKDNLEDHAAIWQYRAWKGEATGWSDIDDLNDMIDTARERIWKRGQRLRYGGETYAAAE